MNEWMKVTQSCPTLCDPMDYTVHGILQARILEWVAFPFSRGTMIRLPVPPCIPFPKVKKHWKSIWKLQQTSTQYNPIKLSSTFLAPGTGCMEDNFFLDEGWWGVRDDSRALHLMCALFLLLLNPLHLRSSGIRLWRLGTPVLEWKKPY